MWSNGEIMFLNRRGTRSKLMLSPLHLTGGFGERTNGFVQSFQRFYTRGHIRWDRLRTEKGAG